MSCSSCGRPLEEGARFCPSCGTPTAATCVACSSPLPAGARFCPSCGTPAGAESSETAEPSGSRERKIATILFADIVGYTRLTEGHDPELVQSLVSSAFDRLSAEIGRYGGLIEKFAGDAMLALFGVPQAHEDDPERGVRAALEMQSAMVELANELRGAGRPELQLRIGLETGEVLVDMRRVSGERDRMVTGDPVNTAARLQAAAAPGAIIVGPGTYAGTRELVEYEEIEPLELKGKALPVPAWRAVRVKARRGGLRAPLGLEAPLIGRDEELGLLKETVRRLTAEGRPHMVTVIGAAGVGKSRLAWELEKYLDGLPDSYHWRKGRYLSYGQVSFGGLIETIRSDAGVPEDDGEDALGHRLAQRLSALGLADDPAVSQALGTLLGASTEAVVNRDDLFEAWRRYLEAIARLAPLVLVLEDIHWADDGSLDFIDFLARWAEAPILLLCLSRHELLERRQGWGGGVANSATIMLEPLDPSESDALLDALLPGSLPAGFKERIVAVAEGNPLFSEELVRMLIDRGIARPTTDGWELAAAVEEFHIPRSIHALLAARLDSLPPSEKRVTQAAAVVGRIFWDAVVAHVVAGARPELDRLLRALRVKELVVAREPSSLAGSREFGFRHVLIRDVAYESLPKSERAEKHLQVARWAEERFAAREEELIELLASHYHSALTYREEAGAGDEAELAELRRRVLEHALRAARRAAELWEAPSATRWFRVALEQAQRLDLPAIERARIALEYLDVAIDSEPVERALAIAREAADLLADAGLSDADAESVLGRIRSHLGTLVHATGRPDEARAMLEQALLADPSGRPTETRARLLWRLGWLTWRAFSAREAVPILEEAVEAAGAVGIGDIERRAIHDLGAALEYAGRIGEGLPMQERSMEMARAAGDRDVLLRGYINVSALLSSATWEVQRADAMMREGLERVRRGGQRLTLCFLANNLALSSGEQGLLPAGLELLADARSAADELGDANAIEMIAMTTPLLLARYGRLEEAANWLQSAHRDGFREPRQSTVEAQTRALVRWPSDPHGAVTAFCAEVGANDYDAEVGRLLARMARRTGQLAAAREAVDRSSPFLGTPRLEAEARWRESLLVDPAAEGVEAIRDVGEQYLGVGYLLTAADAFADAALIAGRVGQHAAAELAARSRELYERCGAVPVLDGTLEDVGSASIHSDAAT